MAEEEEPYDEEEDEEEEMELDLDGGDDGAPGLSLDVDEDDAEALRARHGLNSPKGDADGATPATKFRNEAGINSPKNHKTMDFDGDGDDGAGANPALAGLVTQVARTDDDPLGGGGGGGPPGFITQVERPEKKTDEDVAQSGGWCSCLSSLLCCVGSGSNSTESGTSSSIQASQLSSKPATAKRVNSASTGKTAEAALLPDGGDPTPDEAGGKGGGSDAKSGGRASDTDDDESSSTEYGQALLPPVIPEDAGKKCLVLDLDETLVHSSFKPISTADFIIPVEIDNVVHRVYVMKRPYVDEFLLRVAKHYEIVIFTASLSKYADPLLDQLDTHKTIRHRLFRESCTLHASAYVKDMRRMGRKLKNTIIVDNSPQSYLFQPKNAVPIASWFDDPSDTQLLEFAECCEGILKDVKDVRNLLNASEKTFKWLCAQSNMPVEKFEPK